MKYFDWDNAKNAKPRAERGIGFEDIIFHIKRGDLGRGDGRGDGRDRKGGNPLLKAVTTLIGHLLHW